MLKIGVQTKNIVNDENPFDGFALMSEVGFSCADFSLNNYLANNMLYKNQINSFFHQSVAELETFFAPHKTAAKDAGIRISQMHMPYPIYIPTGSEEINEYLRKQVVPKSMVVCDFFECPHIVVHGLKLSRYLGTEEEQWLRTEKMLDIIAPMAKEMGITICIENLYEMSGNHIVEGPECDVRKVVARIDHFNEKYRAEVLGFCFDTGHANLVGIDYEDFIAHLGKRLKVLHIHDNDGIADLHQIPYTFSKTRENKTTTDWEGFIKGLRKIDYQGVLNFETAPVLNSFPEALKQNVLSFIVQVGKYFAEEIGKR